MLILVLVLGREKRLPRLVRHIQLCEGVSWVLKGKRCMGPEAEWTTSSCLFCRLIQKGFPIKRTLFLFP